MPRKKNGWEGPANSGFKKFDVNPKPKGAAGSYPSFRRFGTTVNRTAIEQWDLDSSWARWRKGLEYYYQAAWLPFVQENPDFDFSQADQRDPNKPNYNPKYISQIFRTILYQGEAAAIPVEFEAYRFATRNADSKTHYVLKRTVANYAADVNLGTVVSVYNDQKSRKDQFARGELWVEVTTDNPTNDYAICRSIGDRITDGTTAASIINVLTEEGLPAVYFGKSQREGCQATVTVPLSGRGGIQFIPFLQDNTFDDLAGKVVYLQAFYQVTPIDDDEEFIDTAEYVQVKSIKKVENIDVRILDTEDNALPPSLYDVQDLDPIYSNISADATVISSHFIPKVDYQKYFKNQYLSAELVEEQVDTLAFVIMPFIIRGVKENLTTNRLEIISEPFQSTIKLITPTAEKRIIVCSDKTFSRQEIDNNADGEYNHAPPIPGEQLWNKLNLDINPWMDQTFVQGNVLEYAQTFSCSCPAYLHAKIRQPEKMDETGNLINRQARAPLPSAKGASFFEAGGITKVAGIINTWADEAYKRDFKICKHTVAAMFINKIRVEEPSTLPSYETRLKFEEKLTADIDEVAQEFGEMLRRSEVTTVELIFSLAEALNMDDVELGYLMQNANF